MGIEFLAVKAYEAISWRDKAIDAQEEVIKKQGQIIALLMTYVPEGTSLKEVQQLIREVNDIIEKARF